MTYENNQADEIKLLPKLWPVKSFAAFMCSFKNPDEKGRREQNAIRFRLWLVQVTKRLGPTDKFHDTNLPWFVFKGVRIFFKTNNGDFQEIFQFEVCPRGFV